MPTKKQSHTLHRSTPPQVGHAPPDLPELPPMGAPGYRTAVFLSAFSATSFFGIALVLACILGVWVVLP